MRFLKRIMVVLLAVMMLLPMTAQAAGSPAKNSLKRSTATAKSVTYNGKKQSAKLTVKMGSKTLTEGKHFVVVGSREYKNAGTYTLKIKGIGKYTGTQTITYTIKKKAQTVSVSGVRSYKATTLKKSKKSFRLTVTRKANAKVTYTTSDPKIKVSKSGKVTLAKGLKKGKYTIYVKTAATKNYKSATKKVTVRVR